MVPVMGQQDWANVVEGLTGRGLWEDVWVLKTTLQQRGAKAAF